MRYARWFMALLLSSHHTVEYKKTMDVPQSLPDPGYDQAMTARLFEVFKDTLEASTMFFGTMNATAMVPAV